MLKKFQNHIIKNFPFLMESKLLIAVSGGLDSMVLLYLLQQLNCKICIAHCNFMLRADESLQDQVFIKNYASQNQITIFVKQFNTEEFALNSKLSIQMAARELRYHWFNNLLKTHNFDYLLTAHQSDDNLESFIINLSRGTGIDGLLGIPEQNQKIIRPLLIFSRHEIENYAIENNLRWREDSSNASDKYLRNKIRHQIVPLLKQINPNFMDGFDKTLHHLQETQNLAKDAVNSMFEKTVHVQNTETYFDIITLKKQPNYEAYLYHFLNKFGFTAWRDIYNLLDAQTGKIVYSEKYLLLKNRNFLILSPIKTNNQILEYKIEKNQNKIEHPIKLNFLNVDKIMTPTRNTIFVSTEKLKYPLVLKQWNKSEIFFPLGMKGKSKMVSKFFKDQKISMLDKKNIWILYSDNQIVWIVGLRQDERFKVTDNDLNILKISLDI